MWQSTGEVVGLSLARPRITSSPLKGTSGTTVTGIGFQSLNHCGPKWLPASSAVLYFPTAIVQQGSLKMSNTSCPVNVNGQGQGARHPSCFIPMRTSRLPSSTPGPAPALGVPREMSGSYTYTCPTKMLPVGKLRD